LKRRNWAIALGIPFAAALLGGTVGKDGGGDRAATAPLAGYAELVTTAQDWSPTSPKPEQLIYASIRAMMARLDPHTTFLDPEEFSGLEEKHRGSYFGVGISMQKRHGHATIVSVVEGSPSWKIGLRPGDVLLRVDGEHIEDLPNREVSEKIRGPKGTTVTLTLLRPGVSQPIEFKLVRAEIPSNSVRHFFPIGPDAGYIHLSDFTQTSGREVASAIASLRGQGMRKLVLDLRGNGGGIVSAAIEISDIFLTKGEKVVYTRGRTRSSVQDYNAPGRSFRFDGPIVVLVNRGSASAAEIVAGAIQDHDRGLILGTTSWGKGLVQGVYTLPYGAGLALTTARYYTPSGRCIQRDFQNFYEYLTPDARESELRPTASGQNVFVTDAGRTVYASGGITPDEILPAAKATPFQKRLQAHGVFFNFAVDYLSRHPEVKGDFDVTDRVRSEFFTFLEKEDVEPAAAARKDYLADPGAEAIDTSIASEILTARFDANAGWKRSLKTDVQLQRALASFGEAARIAALPKKPAKSEG
jgi:carboxyl-terminal processing protease